MEVFELHYPGTRLVNVEDEQKVEMLLYQLEYQLADASISLKFFNEAIARPLGRSPERRRAIERRHARSWSIAREMEAQLPQGLTREQLNEHLKTARHSADLQARREEWQRAECQKATNVDCRLSTRTQYFTRWTQ